MPTGSHFAPEMSHGVWRMGAGGTRALRTVSALATASCGRLWDPGRFFGRNARAYFRLLQMRGKRRPCGVRSQARALRGASVLCSRAPAATAKKEPGMRPSFHLHTLRRAPARLTLTCAAALLALGAAATPAAARTQKPALHGAHWMAVTGKPLAATAGAMIFERGGNAVDAACAMIAATSTMWDTLSWGGETQALIYNPHTGQVIGINGLGVAPTGATPEYFHKLGMKFPPEYGPLAAVTPGTPGGLMTMLAEYGTLSLAQVLAPAIQMADGYPIEAELVHTIEKYQDRIRQWPESRRIMLVHPGSAHEAPEPGEMFH